MQKLKYARVKLWTGAIIFYVAFGWLLGFVENV